MHELQVTGPGLGNLQRRWHGGRRPKNVEPVHVCVRSAATPWTTIVVYTTTPNNPHRIRSIGARRLCRRKRHSYNGGGGVGGLETTGDTVS